MFIVTRGNTMTTTAEKIAVMQAFEEGEIIRSTPLNSELHGLWLVETNPLWDWMNFEYQIYEEESEPFDDELLDEVNFYYQLLKLAKKYNKGWKPDWSNENQPKFFVISDNSSRFTVDYQLTINLLTPCFKSKKSARKAIKKLEEWY